MTRGTIRNDRNGTASVFSRSAVRLLPKPPEILRCAQNDAGGGKKSTQNAMVHTRYAEAENPHRQNKALLTQRKPKMTKTSVRNTPNTHSDPQSLNPE